MNSKKKVDLNCDLGESFGAYSIDIDPGVMKRISSANVACDFNTRKTIVLEKTVN